ncbi:MAG: zinc ABC transporter substrate-binding protein, partial [Holophagales bacterium]|nr:zinc ABC transporter substrate-binding protein [Holophagales bacterium]
PGAARAPVGTVHDGYAYLFQELGLRIHAVVQPRHGVDPTAKQLADAVERIRRAGIRVLFTEMDFAKAYVDTLYRETGCHIARLSHITGGEPGPERFESDMEANLDAILDALEAATADERRANEEAGAGEGLGGARP